jgi:hypothetical protein
MNMPTARTQKPKDEQNGNFPAVPHDHPASSVVLVFNVNKDDSLSLSITGSDFFKVQGGSVYDLVLETIDDSELPHGHGSVRAWQEENRQDFRGSGPIAVALDQRIHIVVTALVPQNAATAPGPFTGTLVVRGQATSRSVPLQGIYLGVVVNSPIGQKWQKMGGESFFGEVRNNAHPAPDGNGTMQEFANGALWDPGHGVFYLSRAIHDKWQSSSVQTATTATGDAVRHALSTPIEDTFTTVESGQAVRFQGGAIVVRSGLQSTSVVYGAIYTLYKSLGDLANASHQPFLGVPVTDETIAPDGQGRFNHFQNGSIYWTTQTGAHEVHGAIRDKWAATGWERGPLAYPVTDETGLSDGAGRLNHFQHGSIYWTAQTGAHEVHGAIRDKWAGLGWQAGLLGYPTTDETGTPDGVGRFNHFQGGSIYWTPGTGAHEVHGLIRERWSELGWERSYLGYPTSDETDWVNPANGVHGRISFFQFGRIGWTAPDGAIEMPDEVSQSQNVVTPSGTALGGWVRMTLRSNGTYTAQFHMHDSGAPDYDFSIHSIWAGNNGISFVSVHSGHVEGTVSTGIFHGPRRDDDFTDNGFNPLIRSNWAAVQAGRLWVTKDYGPTGVIGFVQDAAKALVDVVAGAAGATLGVIIALGSEAGKLFGNLGLGGTFGVIAGVVVFAVGGGVVLAVVAGVAVGVVTNALIKQRGLSPQEAQFAAQVFGNALPVDRIMLTNMSGLGGRAFTMPGVDGKIYLNLGDAFTSPLAYTSSAYPRGGQVLIHELTHAWQIAHGSFLPGLVCSGIVNQANFIFGQSVYVYGPPGPPFDNFNLEAQGAIVDQWFGGNATAVVPNRNAMDPTDPYFGYIANNIRAGRT